MNAGIFNYRKVGQNNTQRLGLCCFPAQIEFTCFGAEKTMSARDVTRFCAFFPARKSGNFLHILGPFPYYITQKAWRKRKKIHWRKFKKNPVETATQNCRFLSLVVGRGRTCPEWLRSGRGTVGRCTGPKWPKRVQTTILVKMTLFRTGF